MFKSVSSTGCGVFTFALLLAGLSGCEARRVPAVEITPRMEWANADPIADRLTTHTPNYLTIHHAGVKDDGSVPGNEKMRRLYRFADRSAREAVG